MKHVGRVNVEAALTSFFCGTVPTVQRGIFSGQFGGPGFDFDFVILHYSIANSKFSIAKPYSQIPSTQ